MSTLFHMNDKDRNIERDLRSPMTDEMALLLHDMRNADSADKAAMHNKLRELETAERVALARRYFLIGGYDRVAEIEGDEIFAFRATQNGVMSDSWSQEPPKGVDPYVPSFHMHEGQRYGRKSTEIGDIVMVNGALFVFDTFGIAPLNITAAEAEVAMRKTVGSASIRVSVAHRDTDVETALEMIRQIVRNGK